MTTQNESADTIASLREALSIYSNLTREAWRLHVQADKPSVLPINMRATPETALSSLELLADIDRDAYQGGLARFVSKSVEQIASSYGPLTTRLAQDDTYTGKLDWSSLGHEVHNGVMAARRCVEAGAVDAQTYNWEPSARAASTLDLALRTIELLSDSPQGEALPADVRIHKIVDQAGVRVRVTDAQDTILGEADHLVAALKQATISTLAQKPSHELTFAEFKAVTTIVNVQAARGATGLAQTGPERLLLQDDHDVLALDQFFRRAYVHQQRQDVIDGTSLISTPPKEWIQDARNKVLAKSFDTDLKTLQMVSVGTLLLNKRALPVTDQTLLAIYRDIITQAIERKDVVPQRVLDSEEMRELDSVNQDDVVAPARPTSRPT